MKRYTDLHWSFSTLGCPELDLGEIVDLARRHQLDQLELRAMEDRVDLPALFRERHGNPAALKAWLAGEGMRINALDTSFKLVGQSGEDREPFLEFVEWAEALEVPYLRIFDGGQSTPQLAVEDRQAIVETLDWWRGLRRQNGWQVDVMVETHDCLCASSAIEAVQEALDEPVAILWDTHHTWKKGGEDPLETWGRIREHVVHTHVKDSISEPSARHPMTYVMLGEGEFNLEGVLKRLQEDGFGGPVSIEWERKWHPYLPPLAEVLATIREKGWR